VNDVGRNQQIVVNQLRRMPLIASYPSRSPCGDEDILRSMTFKVPTDSVRLIQQDVTDAIEDVVSIPA
jgi:hypothetical protein